jgi:aminoglycoside phosphotransferase (APT) family kinase protein
MPAVPSPDPRLAQFVVAQGLAAPGAPARWTPLPGGVSSEIWRVDLPDRTLCVKCALPRLKVAADWRVPVSRNHYEWAWMRFASRHCPGAVPAPIAHDAEQGVLAMTFLDPADHPEWKHQLLCGIAQRDTAAAVARTLAHLHAASAGDPLVEREFPTYDNFHALRLEPYLLATARRHPDLEPRLRALADATGAARIALVHGDVSPKNILVGPRGPVFLDAECAWYGDPAFDVAFCANHLLLKCLARPASAGDYLGCLAAYREAYRAGIGWESCDTLEARAAALLPALLLARVDGKSPVEYVTDERVKQLVRDFARPLVADPPACIDEVADRWRAALPTAAPP